jgi:hypothetical protein
VTRSDLTAPASGALIGAVVALMAVIAWTEVSRPDPFPTTVTALPTPFIVPTSTPKPKLPLTLTPEGLGLVSFGVAGKAAIDQLESILGSPTSDDHWTCAKPAGEVRLVGWADLGVFAIDDVFVGYVDGLHYPPAFGPLLGLETTDGLGIGLDLKDLKAQYGNRLKLHPPNGGPDTNHSKFDIDGEGGIWGVVESGPDGARVITFAAGTTCFDTGP